MSWDLIARCTFRYSIVYAAATAIGCYALLRSGLAAITLVGTGLLSVLFALGGTGSVRMGTAATNATADGLRSGVVDANDLQARAIGADVKLLFYGLGLAAFSVATLVAVG